jgi:glyoxalase/bleomycin resistance protein/dioxygenase superfamily protein
VEPRANAARFTSFHAGSGYLNLVEAPAGQTWSSWGRVIFHVDDVDRQHGRALAAGLSPAAAPRDAPWGERYFHIPDPDGHISPILYRRLQRPSYRTFPTDLGVARGVAIDSTRPNSPWPRTFPTWPKCDNAKKDRIL